MLNEASSYIYFAIEQTFFFALYVAALQLIGPQYIFDYTDVICAWNWRTLSEMKSE